MVANAGICQVRSFLDLDESDWDRMLAVNVKGVVFSFQAAAKHMIASQRPGKLIAACSIAGHQGYAMLSHYCASKFAVRAIVQACAKELASYGIRVNAYCPGIVQTPMWEAMDAQYSQITGAQPGETLRRFARMALIKRAETPEDIVGLVSFLASDDSVSCSRQLQKRAGTPDKSVNQVALLAREALLSVYQVSRTAGLQPSKAATKARCRAVAGMWGGPPLVLQSSAYRTRRCGSPRSLCA